jgi:hypothetical protein
VDLLAERLTSQDITRWMGYFQAVHEIASAPSADLGDAGSPPPRAGRTWRQFTEDDLHAAFRAHNRRLDV